jgi:hypothetical protein
MKDIPDLAHEERQIVQATLRLGHIWKTTSDEFGDFVKTGQKGFFGKPDDPAYVQGSRDALDSLIRRGIVRHVAADQYVLTSVRFELRKS